jgi:hypothetical protein
MKIMSRYCDVFFWDNLDKGDLEEIECTIVEDE